MIEKNKHQRMANAIRFLAADAVETAKSGHPGLPLGAADIATVLFTRFMRFDIKEPSWPNRDRFILSAGHGSMLLYGLLHLLGYEDMPLDALKSFRQLRSPAAGHPEFGAASGIETTTGPLGQGLANAVGFALAERLLNAQFGDDVINHHTYVLAGDGDLMEGISQEALTLAGHLKLSRLIVLFDDNGISIDGSVSLTDSTDMGARFSASGWAVDKADGHDPEDIARVIEKARGSDRPTLIACKTVIGFGAPNKAGTSAAHGAPLGADELAAAREALDWPHEMFEIPVDVRDAWRLAGLRGRQASKEWRERIEALDEDTQGQFARRMRGDLPSDLDDAFHIFKQSLIAKPRKIATRSASELTLSVINQHAPETIGGSADLTGSNNTKTAETLPVSADDFSGRYIHYGIREHAMAAAMNGMALHGGVIPYGGTFLVFSDYCRPAMRLSALMHQRVIYVMTHDSIGLGEDGPTHQPVEHLAALRAIPNLNVMRPADIIETIECWQLALNSKDRPSVLALTRQGLPQLRLNDDEKNLCAHGAYEISAAGDDAPVSLFASGSEVEIATEAKALLADEGIDARVISVPCLDLFIEQSPSYRKETIGCSAVKIAVEAAVRQGWEAVIGSDGVFVGMESFGASAPYLELYDHFGITAERIASLAKYHLEAGNA